MNFNLDWFLSIPGLLITGGVLLLIIALIILIATGRKKKENVEATPTDSAPAATATNSTNNGSMPEGMNSSTVTGGNIMDIPAPVASNPMPTDANINTMNTPAITPENTLTQGVEATNSMQNMTAPTVEPIIPAQEIPAAPTVEPIAPAQEIPAAPMVEPIAPAQEIPAAPTVEPIAPAQEIPAVPMVEPIAPAQEIPAVPMVEPIAPAQEAPQQTAEPTIYGGANPIVPEINIQEPEHQIYGGANPLENTQSIPIANLTGQQNVVQTPTAEPTMVTPQITPVTTQSNNIGQ